MKFMSTGECAAKWDISERSVRNYCAAGRVANAVRQGKEWLIPADAQKPSRKIKNASPLLQRLLEEKAARMKGGIFHKTQIELTYNSNHIEGSMLTQEQTRFIYETSTLGVTDAAVNVDDILETANHFHCINFLLETAERPLTEKYIKNLNFMLKIGTQDSRRDWFNVGDYKKLPNEVSGTATTAPEQVHIEMKRLLNQYAALPAVALNDLLNFHVRFESIHPFQDGNGRVGRLILFKECLRNKIVPFIITDELKLFYYRGLKEWKKVPGHLRDTCLAAQDRYKQYLDYFRIPYEA